ncbi:hypothetical protein [Ensifer sp. 4252]|uniref:hypothetical protein n=1 Tax=Ensifer sp. 4252 TaxID=3373915 RepID=UPI003D1A1713
MLAAARDEHRLNPLVAEGNRAVGRLIEMVVAAGREKKDGRERVWRYGFGGWAGGLAPAESLIALAIGKGKDRP